MKDNALEIGVMGPGAVGPTIGGLLRAAGQRVTFYARMSASGPDAIVLESARGERSAVTGFSASLTSR
jgi:ketopantoate reductase